MGNAESAREPASRDHPIVQWRLPESAAAFAAGAGINPIDEPTTGYHRHDGAVMDSPRVFAIYWGRAWGSPVTGLNAGATNMDSFLASVMPSNYLDWLAQYGSGHGTFLGSTFVDHSPTRPQTMGESDIITALTGWIDTGVTPVVPGPNETNLMFLIFTSSEITLTSGGESGGFCAYHYWGRYQKDSGEQNLYFGVMQAGASTDTVSHELVEAFSDRNGHGWYSDDRLKGTVGSEIADQCNTCSSSDLAFGRFRVASYWLVDEDRCLQEDDLAVPGAVIVPDVVGKRAGAAVSTLEAVHLSAFLTDVEDRTCNNIGFVTRQEPGTGSRVGRDSFVTCWLEANRSTRARETRCGYGDDALSRWNGARSTVRDRSAPSK